MVLPWIIGILGTGASLYVLEGIVSHALAPLSMLAGLLAGFGTLVFLKKNQVLSAVDDEQTVTVAEIGVAVLTGFLAFKALAWILAGAGVVLAVALAGVLFFG